MAIEIDYFAWEKWQPTKEFLGSLVHTNAARLGFDTYIRSAFVMASIDYWISNSVPAVYIFLAENESSPITKLLCISWFYHRRKTNLLYLDEISIDEALAEEFRHSFMQLPAPIPAGMDITPMGLIESYQMDLSRVYGEKRYRGGNLICDFVLADKKTYEIFYTHFDRIITLCQALTVHRQPDTSAIRQAIQTYEGSFYRYAKAKNYQARRPKAKVISSDKKLLEYFKSTSMRIEQNRIDFKFYLPRFLKFIAFDLEGKFEVEHERILFRNLKETQFMGWGERERQAVITYFEALIKYSLNYYPPVSISATSILLAFIDFGIDLAPSLSYWENNLSRVDSLRHLGAFLEQLIEENLTDALPETLSRWLNQASVEKALEDAIAAYEGKPPYAHEFVEALENLRLIGS